MPRPVFSFRFFPEIPDNLLTAGGPNGNEKYDSETGTRIDNGTVLRIGKEKKRTAFIFNHAWLANSPSIDTWDGGD